MAYNIPNGSRVYVASKYDDEIKITEATNAEEAVLTVDDVGGLTFEYRYEFLGEEDGWISMPPSREGSGLMEQGLMIDVSMLED
ncbi:TPA: hypothetical protein ACXN3X_000566 [Proteus mirabilis]